MNRPENENKSHNANYNDYWVMLVTTLYKMIIKQKIKAVTLESLFKFESNGHFWYIVSCNTLCRLARNISRLLFKQANLFGSKSSFKRKLVIISRYVLCR